MARNDFGVFLRTPYNYDVAAASDETAIFCPDTPENRRTKQEFADEVNINTIVRRFGLTGELPKDFRSPMYGDFDMVTDFKSAVDAVVRAGDEFDRMPAELRARFDNDPQKLLEFVADEGNRDEAIKLGLVLPPTVAHPTSTELASKLDALDAKIDARVPDAQSKAI